MRGLDDRALQHIAQYFAALAVPTRLKLLNALRDGERNVSELMALAGCTQANASKHLGVLTQHGLVERRARGNSVYYRIADPRTYELCDLVCGQIGKRFTDQAGFGQMFSRTASKSVRRARRRTRAAASSRT